MDSSGSVFSQTLQEITTAKLEELAKKRSSFEKQKAATIRNADKQADSISMLTALADGTRLCFAVRIRNGKIIRGSSGHPRLENDLRNLNRFIDQARFDPSVSTSIVQQWRQTLLKHLEIQSLKYQYADLYGKLTMEWLTSSIPKVKEPSDEMDISDDYEKVSAKAKLEARQNWERNVFEEAPVDRNAIKLFLQRLFSTKEGQKALSILRKDIGNIEHGLSGTNQFNATTLDWVINGLLASDLLTNEKRQALRDFQSNKVILTELADVLNMRMAALSSWSWGEEVSVEARRQVSGNFNIYMHEDLLQAIFLHYIGVQWSVKIKAAFLVFQNNPEVWNKGSRPLSPVETQRRGWYLGSSGHGTSVQGIRSLIYRGGYFMSQLMDNVQQDYEAEEGDEEANFAEFASAKKKKVAGQGMAPQGRMKQQAQHMQQPMAMMAQQSAAMSQQPGMMMARRIASSSSDEDMGFGLFDNGPEPDPATYKPKNPMDAKQRLLNLLSTEVLVKTRLHGEITCVRSQFKSWNPLLPHGTIETILEFFGVSPKWLKFFKTFLQAPLKFLGEQEEPRKRKRGAPGAHALTDLLGETVLFCLDYAINQQTEGEALWRMHDDFWFWSASHETCVKAWRIIQIFNTNMGVSLDEAKSAAVRMQYKDGRINPAELDRTLPDGDIRWGMIYLDDTTGRFTIDKGMVDKHIEELRRQLKDKERSIFSWVQAYSTYASVFFTSNFGKPANCFGREHLDTMLSMHERIQKTLFSGAENDGVSSVVDWLKKQIEQRFGVGDIPDGYLFFPTSLGGLDVKSPFIGLLQLRDSVTEDPNALIEKFIQAEQDNYNLQKKQYLERKKWEYPLRQGEYRPQNPLEFMAFEEYSQFREQLNYGFSNQLVDVYQTLLKRPEEEPLENDDNMQISEALNRIRNIHGQEQTMTSWGSMTPYWKWVAMLYGPEMIQKFGAFEIVDAGLLPMGMVSLFKSGRVSWQE